MKKFLKVLGHIIILTAPIDTFKIGDSYFSLYRALIIFCVFAIVTAIFFGEIKIKNKSALLWMFLFVFINIAGITVSKQRAFGFPFFLNDCLGSIVIIYFVCVFDSDDKKKLLLTFVRSQYIALFLTAYTLFIHFALQSKLEGELNFWFLKLQYSSNQLDLIARSKPFMPVLFLPYATPPHLDYSLGIAAVICAYFSMDQKQKHRRFMAALSVVFLLIIIATAQKGPILAASFSLIILVFYYGKIKSSAKAFIRVYIFLIAVILLSCFLDSKILDYAVERFREFFERAQSGEDRHILLVLDALRIWTSGIKSFLLGVGYSGAALQEGAYTFIPETFLSTYATLVAERGIIGASILYIFYTRFVFIFFRQQCYERYNLEYALLFNISVFILISFAFYELRYVQTTWIIYAIFTASLKQFRGLSCNLKKENEIKQCEQNNVWS